MTEEEQELPTAEEEREFNSRLFVKAAKHGDLAVVRNLLLDTTKQVDVHVNGDLAFRCAAGDGHEDVVRFLLERGADIHVSDEFGLFEATRKGFMNIVRLLVENGADIHQSNDHVLSCACEHGHLDILQYLLDCGANLDNTSPTLLADAALKNHLAIVQFLIPKISQDREKKLSQALHNALSYGHVMIAKYLICHGAKIQASWSDYEGLLHAIAMKGYSRCLELLMSYIEQADCPAYRVYNPNLIFELAAANGHVEVIKILFLHWGCTFREFERVVRAAVSNGRLELTEYLMNFENREFWTRDVLDVGTTPRYFQKEWTSIKKIHSGQRVIDLALCCAAEHGHLECARYLIKNGANLHAKDDKAYRCAAARHDKKIMSFLVEHGANMNAKNDEVLKLLVYDGQFDMAIELIRHGGINPTILNYLAETIPDFEYFLMADECACVERVASLSRRYEYVYGILIRVIARQNQLHLEKVGKKIKSLFGLEKKEQQKEKE